MHKSLFTTIMLLALVPSFVLADANQEGTLEFKSLDEPLIIKTPSLIEEKKLENPETISDDGEGKFIWIRTEDDKGKVHFVYHKLIGEEIRAYIPKVEEYRLFEKTVVTGSKDSNLDITLKNPEGRFFISYDISPDIMFFVNGEVTSLGEAEKNIKISKLIPDSKISPENMKDNFSLKIDGIFVGVVGLKDIKNNKVIATKKIKLKNEFKEYNLIKNGKFYEYALDLSKKGSKNV